MNRKRIALFFVLILLVTYSAFSKDLAKSQVTTKSLRGLLNKDYYNNSKINDKDFLLIEQDDITFLILVESNGFLLGFTTAWDKGNNISDARLFKILNSWNSDNFLTSTFYEDSTIYMQYTLCFDGGINSENFNSTLEWLFWNANEFEKYLAEEDAI